MNIAVDYDNTYTEDPEFWYDFMVEAKERGYNPVICTFRDERYDMTDGLQFLIEDDFDVYFTRGVAKKWWMEQFGISIHVWIDDRPEAILHNSAYTKADLAVWRGGNLAKSA